MNESERMHGGGTVPPLRGTSLVGRQLAEREMGGEYDGRVNKAYEGAGANCDTASSMPLRERLTMRLKEAHYARAEASRQIDTLTRLLAELTPEMEQAAAQAQYLGRLRDAGIYI